MLKHIAIEIMVNAIADSFSKYPEISKSKMESVLFLYRQGTILIGQ